MSIWLQTLGISHFITLPHQLIFPRNLGIFNLLLGDALLGLEGNSCLIHSFAFQ